MSTNNLIKNAILMLVITIILTLTYSTANSILLNRKAPTAITATGNIMRGRQPRIIPPIISRQNATPATGQQQAHGGLPHPLIMQE